MQSKTQDLLVGALALAYKFSDLPTLRRAFVRATQHPGDLARALAALGLSPQRVEKLVRGARLAEQLRSDALYGVVAVRNHLVGAPMLNACLEELRRGGYQRSLPRVLLERRMLTPGQDQAIKARLREVLPQLRAREEALAAAIDLEGDPEEALELKLAVLLGEVAGQLSFLTREDLNRTLGARERLAAGLPVEEAPAPAPPSAPTQALAGEANPIKGYQLLGKLGAGAMGEVLKARKLDSGEVVALKVLKSDLAGDREYVERFLREAKAVARLNHPSIIHAVQVGRSGKYYFFAMEFVEGQTVAELIKAQGRLGERFALQVTACIAAALAHAWQHRIIHRDIKPDNVMVTAAGEVKLTDLGLARTAKQDSTLTITGVVMGSPAYISPEQATGERNLDTRSDLYSLGATLYHILTGEVPYGGDTPLHVMLKHMNDPVPDLRTKAPQVSEATRQLVFRLMAKRPAERFGSAQEVEGLARSIEAALARGQIPPLPPALGRENIKNERETTILVGARKNISNHTRKPTTFCSDAREKQQ